MKNRIWRKLSITEWENWIITNWKICEWNPNDSTLLEETIRDVTEVLWKTPKNNAFDRWNRDKKVKERIEKEYNTTLHIPKRWKKTEENKKREWTWRFKHHQKFRAWWEWRISLLKRRAGLRKLRVRWNSVETNIWWAIFTDNLKIVA